VAVHYNHRGNTMELEQIISRLIAGETLISSRELREWVSQSEENRMEYVRLLNTLALLQEGKEMDTQFINEDFLRVRDRLTSSHSLKTPTKTRLFPLIFRYAAIVVLALLSGYFLHNFLPGEKALVMNEISVPKGNRSLVKLPDGSKVWLANGSRLLYPDTFTGKTRSVSLEGEAFFSVAKNERNPFIVSIGESRVQVLGTEFSVVAYPGDNLTQIDLVSGSVRFEFPDNKGGYQACLIDPLYSLVFDKASGNLRKTPIVDSFYKYWQNGVFEFRNETFGNLAKKMERIYSVRISLEDSSICRTTFTGAFHIDSNVYTIMETFRRASSVPFDYTIDKDLIHINHVKPKK